MRRLRHPTTEAIGNYQMYMKVHTCFWVCRGYVANIAVYSTMLSQLASVARFSARRDTIPDVWEEFDAAIEKVLTCYEEGLRDPCLRVCSIHFDYVVCIISSEMTAPRNAYTKSSSTGISKLEKHKKFNSVYGLCEQFSLPPSSDIGRWSMHDLESGQALFLDSCLTDYR